jgi:hypothetical protein
MRLVWVHRSNGDVFTAVEAFVATRIWGGHRKLSGDTAAVFVDAKDNMAGAVFFQNYDSETGVIELTGASVSPRFLTRKTLYELYSYAFNTLKCQTAMQVARADDDHQAGLLPRYGFKRFDVPRLKGRNTDAAIYVLHDDVWRANGFHKENEHGQ